MSLTDFWSWSRTYGPISSVVVVVTDVWSDFVRRSRSFSLWSMTTSKIWLKVISLSGLVSKCSSKFIKYGKSCQDFRSLQVLDFWEVPRKIPSTVDSSRNSPCYYFYFQPVTAPLLTSKFLYSVVISLVRLWTSVKSWMIPKFSLRWTSVLKTSPYRILPTPLTRGSLRR